MHRRDFLSPRRLATTAGHVLAAVDEVASAVTPPPDPPVLDEIALLRLGTRAMACGFEIAVPFDTPVAVEAGGEAFELLAELEAQLTVYRDSSEVCRLNRLAPARLVQLEEGLYALLQRARQITEETDGAYDITSGALIKAWGFFKGPRRVPSERERSEALARVGMSNVDFFPDRRGVRYRVRGLEVNLGSIGKGYALDRLGELLSSRWNLPAVLLHGGSSSVYAKGDPHGEERGWPVRIRHPWEPDRHLATVWLRDRALGTSAATFQYLEHEGRKLGHILDPRTGWPASGLASVSVLALTGADADALSTAFYVGGLEVAARYCARHRGVGALILPEEGGLRVLGLAPHEYSLPDEQSPCSASPSGPSSF